MCHQTYIPPSVKDRSTTACDGFTAKELLVVIFLIAIVSVMIIGAAAKMTQAVKISRTRVVLASLRSIATEWEMESGNHVDDADKIAGFVAAAKQLPTTRKMLTALGKDVYNEGVIVEKNPPPAYVNDPRDIVIDSWGRTIRYVMQNDHDGGRNDLPEYPMPFFASPGPDGDLGNLKNEDPKAPPQKDNLYSFDLE